MTVGDTRSETSASGRRGYGSHGGRSPDPTTVFGAGRHPPRASPPDLIDPGVQTSSGPLLDGALVAQAADARAALQVLSGKWVVPILLVLGAGPLRHGELQRALDPRLHQKVLTETLRRMETLGLLTRSVVAEIPPSVTYVLTDLGITLLEPIAQLATWTTAHGDRLPVNRSVDPDPGSTAGSVPVADVHNTGRR